MDVDTMEKLYVYNASFEKDVSSHGVSSVSRKRKAGSPYLWAGYFLRAMLSLLYITAFVCLLRFDEALRIKWDDVRIERLIGPDGKKYARVVLWLPFRKTHQNGGEWQPAVN